MLVSYTSVRDSVVAPAGLPPSLVTVRDAIGLRIRDSVTRALDCAPFAWIWTRGRCS